MRKFYGKKCFLFSGKKKKKKKKRRRRRRKQKEKKRKHSITKITLTHIRPDIFGNSKYPDAKAFPFLQTVVSSKQRQGEVLHHHFLE